MTPTPDLVIGLDSSTTACKAIAWDMAGTPVAEGRCSLPLTMPRPGWHEQPAAAWWSAAVDALRQLTQRTGTDRLAALSISHQRETFVPLDAQMEPLRDALVWMDERCGYLLPELARRLGAERFHSITGRPLSGNLTVGKIVWLQQNEPETWAAARWFVDVQAFLVYRLTGRLATGWGSADPMGLFDMRARDWSAEVLAGIGLPAERLPELHPPGAVLGAVTREAAGITGLPAGLPVVAGLGDGQAAGLGANITRPGPAYLSLGTSVVSGTRAAAYVADRAFRTTCAGVPGAYLLETVLLGGAYTVAWFLDTFGKALDLPADRDAALARLETDIASIPPGANGLLLVPYWNSALNPYWDSAASGITVGWRGIHTPLHLYRAILEGVAFEQRLHTEGVEAAAGERVDEYIVMGGGSRSDAWCQIVADVTGRAVRHCATAEASSLGAGMLAAAGVGLYESVAEAAAAMSRVEEQACVPDAARHVHYTRLYTEVYRGLYPALQPYLARLAESAETSELSSPENHSGK
jgi:sugar (pentulose or hexulose) kinase